jgi:hypothetical protein
MSNVEKWWHRMTFWKKVERSLGVIGALGVMELGIQEAPYQYFIVIGIVGVISKLILIWIEDNDGDGIADIMQGK